jgi:hypothetical protein
MQSPFRAALVAPILLLAAVAVVPSRVEAQGPAHRPSPAMLQLGALSRERAMRWAVATPAIRCAPAPLTESPSAAGEAGRPHVAPLEEAFLDAAIVKRTFASRTTINAGPARR